MKFMVGRTSLMSHEDQPCEEAVRFSYVYTDRRNVDDPAKLPSYTGDSSWWNEDGLNHRIENGMIARDILKEGWMIEVNTLEELLDLSEKYGEIIIAKEHWRSDLPHIEIYDDYRE